MVQNFTTVSLTGRRIAEALPLVQATWPNVKLTTWRGFVRSFLGKTSQTPAAVVALLDDSGGLCGVLAYRCEFDLADGLVLFVRVFSAIDIQNSLAPTRALLNAAKVRAHHHRCHSIHIQLTPGQSQLERRIRSLGVVPLASVHRASLDGEARPH